MIQKLKKLKRMSAGEISCRVREKLRVRTERRIWERTRSETREAESAERSGHSLTSRSRALVIGASHLELEDLKLEFETYFQGISLASRQTVEGICSGRWDMLGHEYDLRAPFTWHSDPITGHQWEQTFYADISLSIPGSDVKYVWEPSRHQCLAELARHWLIYKDAKAAEFALDHLDDWIRENPLYEGVNWTSALEPAMRAIAWAWALPALELRLSNRSGLLDRVSQSLIDHATYLEHHLSYYSSPFNHLIGEAVGLYLISYLLDDHADCRRWRNLSRSVLQIHTERQFYADGMTVEQAMGYHFYTLGFLVMAILIARLEQCPMPHVEEVVHQAFRAGTAFRRPDGTWPPIGDLDNARSLPCHPANYWDFGSMCSLAAVMFDDPSLIVDDSPGQELYWLRGTDGVRKWYDLYENSLARKSSGSERETGQQYFLPHCGYVIASKGSAWFLFDAGPIAGGLFEDSTPSTAHGHADTLQVLFSMNGASLLRDSGIASYADKPHADFMRSAKAHNTVEVEGVSVARHAGHLAWSNVASPPSLHACLGTDVWLTHGQLALNPKVSISRYILGLPDCGLWIADLISTDRTRKVSWYWQIGTTELIEEKRDAHLVWGIGKGEVIKSYCAATSRRTTRFEKAAAESQVGWAANGYGVQQPAGRLSFQENCDGKLFALTYIGLDRSDWTMERVESNGISIDCIEPNDNTVDRSGIGSQITWTLSNGSQRRTYFGGIQPSESIPGLPHLVSRAGNWPCAEKYTHR